GDPARGGAGRCRFAVGSGTILDWDEHHVAATSMQSVVPVTGDDVVVRRHAAGGIVVGHVVSVGSPARVVTARGAGAEPLDAPSPLIPGVRLGAPRDIALVGAAPAGGDVAHGVNARGLLVGAQRPGPVRRVLERAASVDEALALLDERGPELGDPIHLADAQGAATLTPGRSGPEVRRLRSADLAAAESADLFDLFQTVAAATVASAVVAHLDHSGARTVHVCLGPPCCGPFIRLWPGLEVSSAIGGSPDGPPELAVLTSALAVALEGGAVDPV